MSDFFSIKTSYSSEDYKLMKAAVNENAEFKLSEFKKNPTNNNEFIWNIHSSELPVLYKKLNSLYESSKNDDFVSLSEEIQSKTGVKFIVESTQVPIQEDVTEEGFEINEKELREMIRRELASTEDMAENDSISLTNKHGENLKPENLDEVWGDRYEKVMFAQGDEAQDALMILNDEGPEAALEFLKHGHYPGEHDASNELSKGASDETFEKDGYIMTWNNRLGYIGLEYDTQHGKQVDEDSQMKRHQAGQRGKDVPLGQHAPHSQAAIKENKSK